MTVSALIADDEAAARDGLRDMLAAIPWITCVGEAGSGTAALSAINSLRPDLVFLDIQMPGLSGIDVLRQTVHRPAVIFTTAFAEHAVAAFELGAIDYLLKPFGVERLTSAAERVRRTIGEAEDPAAAERLAAALAPEVMTRLFVRAGNAIVPVPVERIVHVEAWGDYVKVHAGGAPHVLHLSLTLLASRLDPARFVRIHRAHLVNLDQVSAFRSAGKGRLEAVLRDGTRLPVSRQRAQELRGRGA